MSIEEEFNNDTSVVMSSQKNHQNNQDTQQEHDPTHLDRCNSMPLISSCAKVEHLLVQRSSLRKPQAWKEESTAIHGSKHLNMNCLSMTLNSRDSASVDTNSINHSQQVSAKIQNNILSQDKIENNKLLATKSDSQGDHANHYHHQKCPLSSSSSSSSSASDSALSRSQQTLESDNDQSSSSSSNFRRSLNGSCTSAYVESSSTTDEKASANSSSLGLIPPSNSPTLTAEENDNDGDEDEDEDEDNDCDPNDDECCRCKEQKRRRFDLIWRDLSFAVPEKRLDVALRSANEFLDRLMPWTKKPTPAVDAHTDFSHKQTKNPMANNGREFIFKGLNGRARSGQLTAILGPSGAGKTTLLNCLTSSRINGVSGCIEVSGDTMPGKKLKLCTIPQKDYLFNQLTVMENLLFASRIKNTSFNFDHKRNVEKIVSLLRLSSCLSIKTSKLSGGQYKQVSIAQELLSKPDILILDEPTSGLDSLTCFKTVTVLRDLVDMSRKGLISPLAVVMTIHQPQSKIFNLFNRVYVLSSLGQCVYDGKPRQLIEKVASCCKLLPPSDDRNAASFIIEIASGEHGDKPIEQLARYQLEQQNKYLFKYESSTKVDCRRLSMLADYVALHKQQATLNLAGKCISKDKISTELANYKKDTANNSSQANKCMIIDMALPDACCFISDVVGKQQNKLEDKQTNRQRLKKTRYKHQSAMQELNNGQLWISNSLIDENNKDDKNFWLHVRLLVIRLWMSMWRDSLTTTTRVLFHILVPFVFYLIYSQKSGAANACPKVEREYDLKTITSEESMARLSVQHNELILTFENLSLFFLLLYSFSMCVLAITALSFPLNMHILLKETSNGWYSISRFVMAKTLADLPIELLMPITSVSITYILTGQPSSYLCWRMLAVTAVMTICSLISQTQGLIFGAIFMHNVQASVFVSQASSLPWIMLSGFTTRINELPSLLQWLSFGSIYRLGIECIMTLRYGYGVCSCNENIVNNNPVRFVGIPDQLRSLIKYYLSSYATNPDETIQTETSDLLADNSNLDGTIVRAINSTMLNVTDIASNITSNIVSSLIVPEDLITNTSTTASVIKHGNIEEVDVFQQLASTMSRANSYGTNIITCNDVKPFILTARDVNENVLPTFVAILISILVTFRILLFYAVRYRVNAK